jgi:hypothetical protein
MVRAGATSANPFAQADFGQSLQQIHPPGPGLETGRCLEIPLRVEIDRSIRIIPTTAVTAPQE